MKKLRLAVLPGDGIGKDVTLAAVPIFKALNLPVEIVFGDIGWECWQQHGNPVPAETWDLIKTCDAVLLGATTSMPEKEAIKALPVSLQQSPPSYVSPIVQLRQKLDLYANIRPCFNIKGDGEDFNFCVIRENTEGLYAGLDFYPLSGSLLSVINEDKRWKHVTDVDASCSLRLQTRKGLERLFEYAFEYAAQHNFQRVTFADKPNVLRKSSHFAREIFENIAQKYPHIEADIHNVDAVALWMVRRPQEFGVIVAENMFGDILSDLGAGVMGGLGFAASANIGANGCYFEPVHGSAPRIKPNKANPGAMFLTIGLLLEHFGYVKESNEIKRAVHEVVREGRCVTYDLGGNASTQEMANAIIEHCLQSNRNKKISLLSTGNEIIQGEIQDTNGTFFAKTISDRGGQIYQCMQVSDAKKEITSALSYLLNKSDAVVVCGGLGPTSDDTTRFAISDVIKKELHFNESAWTHVVKRLTNFGLAVTDANRQQALFPQDAELYPNENGTAFGCHAKWQGKHIFMLPGPPRECKPLFDNFVISTLEAEKFFNKKHHYRWLTLGLIEGEIAPQIDAIIQSFPFEVESAYRWNYPYLEIKLLSGDNKKIEKLIESIEAILLPYLVSKDGKNALEVLELVLPSLSRSILLIDDITSGQLANEIHHPNLKFIDGKEEIASNEIIFHVKSSRSVISDQNFQGSVDFECSVYNEHQKKYQHCLTIPFRSAEVIEYAKNYIAWQLQQFIKLGEI